MKLLTKSLLVATPPLYTNDNKEPEQIPVTAKFFTPWTSWTWYMTEYDPTERLAFGYARNDAQPENAELGYFSLDELEATEGPGGLRVERDMYFGQHTLAEVLSGAVR